MSPAWRLGPPQASTIGSQLVPAPGCARVRSVAKSARLAALKSEGRIPRPEIRPKSEIREWLEPVGCYSAGVAMDSGFGHRISFGLRSSSFGFGPSRVPAPKAIHAPLTSSSSFGFTLALGWLGPGLYVACTWLEGRMRVARGWLLGAYRLPTKWLWGGFRVALGGFVRPFDIGCWMFDVRCWMFRTANRPGSQGPRGQEGARKSNTQAHSDPLRTGTVRGPSQNLMQPCCATSQAGMRLAFSRRGLTCRSANGHLIQTALPPGSPPPASAGLQPVGARGGLAAQTSALGRPQAISVMPS